MKSYVVTWAVNVEAAAPEAAAKLVAAAYFQDRIAAGEPDTACVFLVRDEETGKAVRVDLSEQ